MDPLRRHRTTRTRTETAFVTGLVRYAAAAPELIGCCGKRRRRVGFQSRGWCSGRSDVPKKLDRACS